MSADAKPRWITVHRPFDYHWPGRSAITAFTEPGEYMVKAEVADFATANGHAAEGKLDGSEARSRKGKTARAKKVKMAVKESAAANPADSGTIAPVGDTDTTNADRAADRPAVDPDAS